MEENDTLILFNEKQIPRKDFVCILFGS